MKNKHGGPSLRPPYLMTMPLLAALGVGFAARVLVQPVDFSAEELRRLAAIYLIAGVVLFSFITVAQGLVETIIEGRKARRDAAEFERRLREDFPAFADLGEGAPEAVHARGLCGNRDAHEPHLHDSSSLGTFWCTADESERLPFAAERRRRAQQEEGGVHDPST